MKREDISRLFEGATDEQISALLDINSQDIGRAKRGGEKLQADLDAASEALKSANETIAALEANKADVEKLQRQIDAYKQAEAERAETERQAREEADLEARFSAAAGGRKFLHEMVREGVKRAFGAALKDQRRGLLCPKQPAAAHAADGRPGHAPHHRPGGVSRAAAGKTVSVRAARPGTRKTIFEGGLANGTVQP